MIKTTNTGIPRFPLTCKTVILLLTCFCINFIWRMIIWPWCLVQCNSFFLTQIILSMYVMWYIRVSHTQTCNDLVTQTNRRMQLYFLFLFSILFLNYIFVTNLKYTKSRTKKREFLFIPIPCKDWMLTPTNQHYVWLYLTGFFQKYQFIPCNCLTNSNEYVNYMPSMQSALHFTYFLQVTVTLYCEIFPRSSDKK